MVDIKENYIYQRIGLVCRVFANGLGDLGSIPGRIILKILKMRLDTALLNSQQYKVHIKSKVEQSRERSCTLSYTSGVVPIEKGAFWSPNLLFLHIPRRPDLQIGNPNFYIAIAQQ